MTAPKVGLPIHDATVEFLAPKPERAGSSDGMPGWAVLVLIAIVLFAVIAEVAL